MLDDSTGLKCVIFTPKQCKVYKRALIALITTTHYILDKLKFTDYKMSESELRHRGGGGGDVKGSESEADKLPRLKRRLITVLL